MKAPPYLVVSREEFPFTEENFPLDLRGDDGRIRLWVSAGRFGYQWFTVALVDVRVTPEDPEVFEVVNWVPVLRSGPA